VLIAEEALIPAITGPLARAIADQPGWSDLPVLLLTAAGASSPSLRMPMETLGNVTLLERPVRAVSLISAANSALRARRRQYALREAEARKDEFLAALGHELRNPLAPIRTSAAYLNRVFPDNAPVRQVTGIVERQVAHLTRLVDDLLDVARITRGKIVLQRAPTTLAALVEQALEITAALAVNARHTIEVSQPDHEVPLNVDHARMVQSIANVMANAIKFTPPGGRIALAAAVTDGSVEIRVRDSGIGMEADALTRIFDLFEQSEAGAGQIKGGLGIGLSLARQFIEMHGGAIHAESAGLGLGSEFIMRLPREPAWQADAAPPAAKAAQHGAVKVLVVDDNKDAADTLAMLLEADGFVVACAYDGVEAQARIRDFRPGVVVMDLGMPVMDGYEAARRIRTLPEGERVTLIALTGWGTEGTRKKAIDAGFDFHTVKPVNFGTLKGLIAQS
jgi:signal transduction histidine kinase